MPVGLGFCKKWRMLCNVALVAKQPRWIETWEVVTRSYFFAASQRATSFSMSSTLQASISAGVNSFLSK